MDIAKKGEICYNIPILVRLKLKSYIDEVVMSKGYIYILKNPSFPDYVKIGYADDVEERVKQLNSSECTPFAFRVYATYEVNSRLLDKKIHSIIDKLNPNYVQ